MNLLVYDVSNMERRINSGVLTKQTHYCFTGLIGTEILPILDIVSPLKPPFPLPDIADFELEFSIWEEKSIFKISVIYINDCVLYHG